MKRVLVITKGVRALKCFSYSSYKSSVTLFSIIITKENKKEEDIHVNVTKCSSRMFRAGLIQANVLRL